MSRFSRRFSNLSLTVGILLIIAALLLLMFQVFKISSDALLSLISAIIGGLIATSSQAWISALNRQNQLRLAAIDRRLDAHQQAYALWRKLIFTSTKEPAFGDVIIECQTWWNNNCLYLDPESRKAFFNAYMAATDRPFLLGSRDTLAIQENYGKMISAGEVIVKGIALPTIGELEIKFANETPSIK